MTVRYTSRVGVATLALCERLMAPAVIPNHPETGEKVRVVLGDRLPAEQGEEIVAITSSGLGEDGDQEWARLGPPGRNERFTLHVVARSLVSTSDDTNLTVLRRMIVIADAIQDQLFQRVGNQNVIPLGYAGEVITTAGTPTMTVVPTFLAEIPLGWFDLPIRFQAEI